MTWISCKHRSRMRLVLYFMFCRYGCIVCSLVFHLVLTLGLYSIIRPSAGSYFEMPTSMDLESCYLTADFLSFLLNYTTRQHVQHISYLMPTSCVWNMRLFIWRAPGGWVGGVWFWVKLLEEDYGYLSTCAWISVFSFLFFSIYTHVVCFYICLFCLYRYKVLTLFCAANLYLMFIRGIAVKW